jgi:hypothetical protein
MPPATAAPLTAAITGLDSNRRDGPIGPSACAWPGSKSRSVSTPGPPSLRAMRAPACRSQPAQKCPCAPWNTATRAWASPSNATKASYNARAVSASTALRTAGRSSVTTVTASNFSIRTDSVMPH